MRHPHLLAAIIVVGCGSQASSSAPDAAPLESVGLLAKNKLDLLVVVDNSGGMTQKQEALTAGFPLLVDALGGEDALPSMHVGVVSTDVGIGGYSLGGCTGEGDDGKL